MESGLACLRWAVGERRAGAAAPPPTRTPEVRTLSLALNRSTTAPAPAQRPACGQIASDSALALPERTPGAQAVPAAPFGVYTAAATMQQQTGLSPHLAVVKAFSALMGSGARTKADLRDFEKLLIALDSDDVESLVRQPELWRLLHASLPDAEASNWDVMVALLNRLSMEAEARQESLDQGFTTALGEALTTKGRSVRGDKQIDRVCSMACVVSLLCVDAPASRVQPWCKQLCQAVLDSLERAQAKGGPIMEAYTFFSLFIKFMYTATGTPLATLIASTLLSSNPGAPNLLFHTARRGLLEEQLTGAPKVRTRACEMVWGVGGCGAPCGNVWLCTR